MESNYRNPGPPMGYNVPQSGHAAPPVRLGEWIGEGWRMFTEQWKGWVTIALGMFVVVAVPTIIFMVVIYGMMVGAAMDQASRGSASASVPPSIWGIYLAFFGFMLLLLPLAIFLVGGMYRAALKQLRGGKVEFKDLFSAKDCYLRLLGAAVLLYFVIMIGSMLCIIPGLIAAGLLIFTLPLIVDRNMGVIDAMKLSYEVTKPNMLMFAVFAFVVQLIASVGQYACGIGMLATYPLMFTIHAVAFRDCFGVPGARSYAQQSPPPSIYAPPQPPHPMSHQSPMSQQPPYPPPMSQQPPFPPQPPPVAQARPPAPAQNVCPNCQSKLPATAVFCPKCGTGVRRP